MKSLCGMKKMWKKCFLCSNSDGSIITFILFSLNEQIENCEELTQYNESICILFT